MKKFPALSSLLIAAFLLIPNIAFSADFGFLADSKYEAENELFTYTPSLTPWFSWNGNNGVSVYLSCLLPVQISIYNEVKFIPELTRFAFNYRNNRISLEAGRIYYNDVSELAASGLFDGLHIKVFTSAGNLSIGGYYSGFLYKETAKIVMTDSDTQSYVKSWGKDNIGGYFASRRILASLRWDMPLGKASNFSFEALAQFDLNGNDETLHSQYGALQFDFIPANIIKITTGALFELMQNQDGNLNAAFGALAQFRINLPTAVNDSLGVKAKFSTGAINDTFTYFTPINSIPQGMAFSGTILGLTAVSLNYDIRIIQTLYAEFAFNYFMRTPDSNKDYGNLHGGELWTSFAWQPHEDLRVTLGGGAFFPKMGNIDPSGKIKWKVIAGFTLAL